MKKLLAVLLIPYWIFFYLALWWGAIFVLFLMLISKSEFTKDDWLLVLNAPVEETLNHIIDFLK